MLEYLAKMQNTKMKVSIAQSKEILSDSTRIKQILVNLISNSLKFTIDGSILVTVSYEE
jgi:signal transduction histidine kinase